MATYRLVRILRAILPVIVLVLIGIPARNYWKSRDQTVSAEPKTATPVADLKVHSVELSFSRFDGRPLFRLTAKEEFSFKNNTHRLRGVHVVISGEKPGDFDRVIIGDECLYDEMTRDVHFTGNVKAQLDATTFALTEELIYVNKDGLITSPVRTHIEQPGEMTGDVDQLKYWMASELLLLSGNVAMHMSNGESLHTDVAEFQKKENWASVKGGVLLEATNGWLRGNSGRADLQPGTYRPVNVTIDGNVTSESHGANSSDTLKTHSSSMTSILTPAGAIQHVFARGDVRADQLTQGTPRTITGSEVEASLNERGHVETMEARQATHPYAKMVGSDRSLVSDVIRIKSDGTSIDSSTITTGEHSTLDAGGSTITGRAFKIVQADKLAFDTPSRATITSVTKSGTKRKTTGDVTQIDINGKTNALEKLTQTGKFEFSEGENRSGSADKGVITDGGNRVELTGNFSFKDGTRSGKAGRALFTENGNTVEMWEAVSFKDTSRHGSAAYAKFSDGGDRVDLNSPTGPTASVVDEVKKLELRARKIEMNQSRNQFEAWTEVFTDSRAQSDAVTVYAAHAKSENDLIRYDGKVELFRGTTSEIRADSITPDKNNGFTAVGHVNSKIEGMKAEADKLVYNGTTNTAVYSGNVHAVRDDKKGSMDLRSAEMILIIDPGDPKLQKKAQLKDLKADGNVKMTQGARRGTGDHLVYNYASDEVTLTSDPGSLVTVDDPPNFFRDITWANWAKAGGKISFDNRQGGKVSGITPVKK
jgi:lipopolysaccharide export system protein LptA